MTPSKMTQIIPAFAMDVCKVRVCKVRDTACGACSSSSQTSVGDYTRVSVVFMTCGRLAHRLRATGRRVGDFMHGFWPRMLSMMLWRHHICENKGRAGTWTWMDWTTWLNCMHVHAGARRASRLAGPVACVSFAETRVW